MSAPTISGRLHVRVLGREPRVAGRLIWDAIHDAPDGVDLVLTVAGDGHLDPGQVLALVVEQLERARSITIESCDAGTVRRWTTAARAVIRPIVGGSS